MKNSNIKMLTLTALFAALTAILSQIQIPAQPIVFNLAVLAVFMAGVMLPPLYAFASVLIYIMLGAVGIPVFAGFMAGPGALIGMTGGYIWGYIAIATITSYGARLNKNALITAFFMALGLVFCYALGTAWFMYLMGTGLYASLAACVFPFIIPDIAKGVFAYALGKMLLKRLAKANLYYI